MKKLLLIAVVAGGLMIAGPRVLMLKFTSVSGSVRAITAIILTGTVTLRYYARPYYRSYYRPYYRYGGHRYYRNHHRYPYRYRY